MRVNEDSVEMSGMEVVEILVGGEQGGAERSGGRGDPEIILTHDASAGRVGAADLVHHNVSVDDVCLTNIDGY